jgi:uncharacterized protein
VTARDTRAVAAERDLAVLLATLDVERRPGTFVYHQRPGAAPPVAGALAMIDEGDTTTYIVDEGTLDGGQFRSAWLTLTVHSALDAVGLTAAVASALASEGIPANVLDGYVHDHLLVPVERADDAIAAIRALSAASRAATA